MTFHRSYSCHPICRDEQSDVPFTERRGIRNGEAEARQVWTNPEGLGPRAPGPAASRFGLEARSMTARMISKSKGSERAWSSSRKRLLAPRPSTGLVPWLAILVSKVSIGTVVLRCRVDGEKPKASSKLHGIRENEPLTEVERPT